MLAAVSISFGMRLVFKESLLLQGVDSAIDLLIMRYKDITQGIKVFSNANGQEVRKDKKIGRKSMLKTAITRFMLPYAFVFVNSFLTIFTFNQSWIVK